ncbi:hypothetical protein CDAR_278301 [Caerostris darwini]|uniref:Uncharacterized protein n=1 Tax=Caerostris darwini TaxID=1538125 RepID=A0AAV4WQ37_9ARAC|nr:hypothetical protein CDAR_278301 [Caerostris darwini]
MHEDSMGDTHEKTSRNPALSKPLTNRRRHQVHGSGSSVAYLQYRRGTPVNHRGGGAWTLICNMHEDLMGGPHEKTSRNPALSKSLTNMRSSAA